MSSTLPNDAKTYAFRITCSLTGGEIETKEREIHLELPEMQPIAVFLARRDDQAEQWSLTVWCAGFDSEPKAHVAGLHVKTALVLAGVLLGVGIDAGNDQVVSPDLRLKNGSLDERLKPEVHGLQVVPDIEGLLFGSLWLGRPLTRISPANFQKKVAESYALRKLLTKKQFLSAQLYNQSHFHSSEAVRFLTLISAVEALAERKLRSPDAVQLIERMTEMTKASLKREESETQSLIGGLNSLKYESIGSSCRVLVRRYIGDSAAKAFTHAYEVRSTLLHTGVPPAGTNFEAEIGELDPLVRKLLVRHFST